MKASKYEIRGRRASGALFARSMKEYTLPMENTQNKFSMLIPLIAIIIAVVGAYAYMTSDERNGIEKYEDKEVGIRFKFPAEWKVYKNRVGNIYYLFKESEGEVKDIAAEVLDKNRTNIVVELGSLSFNEDSVKQLLNPSEFEVRPMNGLSVMRFVSTGFEVVSTSTKPYLTYALSSPFEGKRSIWVTLHPYNAASTTEIAAAEQIVNTFDITKRDPAKTQTASSTTP
jgi:hypothetical protein